VAVSKFIQIIVQISRLRYASLEMTTKLIPARKPPISPNLPAIYNLFMQNKANVKMGKMNISKATIKDYDNEQRTINNERYSKQTQFKAKQSQSLDLNNVLPAEGPCR